MPLRNYDLKAEFDADYTLFWPNYSQVVADPSLAISTPLPAANVVFLGNSMTVTPMWSRPLVGGSVSISLGRGHTLNHGRAIITNISGSVISVTGSKKPINWPLTDIDVPDEHIIYSIPIIKCHYLAAVMRDGMHAMMSSIIAALELDTTMTIALVGVGMGWEAERLDDLGYNAIGIDTSTWVQSVQGTVEDTEIDAAITDSGLNPTVGEGLRLRALMGTGVVRTQHTVLDENMLTNRSRGVVKQALGLSGNTKIDWVISMNILPGLDDTEIVSASTEVRKVATNVAHYTSVFKPEGRSHPDSSWKTLEQWKVLLPDDLLVEAGTYRVL